MDSHTLLRFMNCTERLAREKNNSQKKKLTVQQWYNESAIAKKRLVTETEPYNGVFELCK